MTNFKRLLTGLAIVLVAQFAHAGAAYTRAAIGPGYSVDWSTLGLDDMTTTAPGFSVGGVTVSGASAFTVFNGSTFNADFLADDTVLSLFDVNAGEIDGEIDLAFATAVRSVGAQVQSYFYGSFGGLISAYDSDDNLIESYAVSGVTGNSGDGSAVFAGIVSDSLNISRVVFSNFGAGAAINWLSVGNTLDGDGGHTVPEPESLLLALTALAAIAVARRRRA